MGPHFSSKFPTNFSSTLVPNQTRRARLLADRKT
jgi:hypothetical protein